MAPEWRDLLVEHGLGDFCALWNIEIPLLDKPNTGRGRSGWSAVGLLSLEDHDGSERKLILKRQKNYAIRTLLHPIRGIPTLRNEASNITRFDRLEIPAMKLAYYGERREAGEFKAILITEYLDGYESLDAITSRWREEGWPEGTERRRLIASIAHLVHTLHEKGMRHNSLYPKHIFVRYNDNGEPGLKLIDLEKVRWQPIGNAKRIRDLDSLNRRSSGWTRTDRLRFFKSYCLDRLRSSERRLYRRIAKRSRKTA